MRNSALLTLLFAAACASGPAPRPAAVANGLPSEKSRLEDDRAIASTLRSIGVRARKGEAAQMRAEFVEQARQRPNDWRPRLFAAWTGAPSEESWQDVAKVCRLNPEEPWPWAASGAIYLQWKGFVDQADAEFAKALKARPGFVPALVGKADVLRVKGQLAEAKAAFEAVLEKAPDWEEALVGLGLTQVGLADPAAAAATLDRALKVEPEDPVAVFALAKLALAAGDRPKAILQYQKMLQFNPRDRDAHLSLAQLKHESGDLPGESASLEAAMAIAPDLATAKALAESFKAQARTDDEVKALEKVAQLDTRDAAPYLRISEIRKAEGDSEGALTSMRQAADRAPADPAVHLLLARLIAEGDDLVEAIEAFRDARQKGAKDVDADLAALEAKAGLGKPLVGDATRVYYEVFGRLNKRFQELQKKNPALGGKIRARATIGDDGKVEKLEMLEDTVHEATLTALVYFSLKDAKYPKAGTPGWEFVLNPVKK
jgi:tetratricopeptide (TPR) repeat protein